MDNKSKTAESTRIVDKQIRDFNRDFANVDGYYSQEKKLLWIFYGRKCTKYKQGNGNKIFKKEQSGILIQNKINFFKK